MRYIYVILTVLILLSGCNTQSSPNTHPAVQPTPPPTTIQPTTSNFDEVVRIARAELERDAYKQALEAYQKSFETIKWILAFATPFLLAFITYIGVKNKKEYENVLNQAKEASERAEQWEEKARNTCNQIDDLVKTKLTEIESKSEEQAKNAAEKLNKLVEAKVKESIQKIDDKSAIERRINELWSDAVRLQKENNYKEASEKCAEVVQLMPNMHEAYDIWGVALCDLAKLKVGTPQYEELLAQAEEKFLKAESLKKGSGAYDLACVYARRGNKEECRKWLLVGQEAGTLMTRDHAMKDKDLESVRGEAWFKEIKWRGEK